MSQGLIRRLTVLSQYEEALVRINATATERLTALKAKPQAATQRDLLSICNDPFTVAQQLTHIELVRITHLFTETNQSNSFIQCSIQVFHKFFCIQTAFSVLFATLDTRVLKHAAHSGDECYDFIYFLLFWTFNMRLTCTKKGKGMNLQLMMSSESLNALLEYMPQCTFVFLCFRF